MKFKKVFTTLAFASLAVAGALFVSQSVKGQEAKEVKATTDIGEISMGGVRNEISNASTLYLLPTQDYELPNTWDYAYAGVGEEDGIFINGEKYNGTLVYAGTGSAHITFWVPLPSAAVEGDVVEFKGKFASAASGYSFTLNYAAQRFAETWVHALEDYDVVSLVDANLPNISNQTVNTDDMSGLVSVYTEDPFALPTRNGYFGVTNSTGSYAFQFNHKKTSTATGWAHVLIGGRGPLWNSGHFIDFGFLDNWAPIGTGHAQIREMRGKGNNWEADELQATGAIALGWNVGETNLLEMGMIKVKNSNQHYIFFKVNGVLKFGEYWTLAEDAMTTKVTLQYGGTDATFSNSIEPESAILSAGTYVSDAKQLYLNMPKDICPPVHNWDDYFKSVDGNGLKLNGEAVGVSNWNFFKKTGSNQMFIALGNIGITPAADDILYIGGMFKAAKENNGVMRLYKVNFAPLFLKFDGVGWSNLDYEIEDFCYELLENTCNICAAQSDGNHDALASVWATMAGEDHYFKLSQYQKEQLAAIIADSSVDVPTDVEEIYELSLEEARGAAMYRYDYCTGKYSLNNFITGRTPIEVSGGLFLNILSLENNSTIVIVIAIVATTMLSFTLYLVLKKKKKNI